MPAIQCIFLLGSTGYIGGSLLVRLLEQYPSATFSVLVRNSQSAEAVKSLAPTRINVVLGSQSDPSIIEAEVQKADITINTANCDDLDLITSIINGFKKKLKKGILIHTSGTAVVLAEDAKGPFLGKLDDRGSKIWDDTKTDDIRAIPLSAMHRPVDVAVLDAHNSGILDAYIICPGSVYGPGIGPVKTTSIQIPLLLQIASRRREIYIVGEGTNIWCNIHILDLLQLYTDVINHALTQAELGVKVDAYNNYYFAASSENSIKEVTDMIAAILHKKGLVDSPHARSISPGDPDEQLVSIMLGHTSRAVSVRAKQLGWSPKEKKLNESGVLEAEIENILKTAQTA